MASRSISIRAVSSIPTSPPARSPPSSSLTSQSSSIFASSSHDGVVLGAGSVSPPSTIPLPAYRQPLPPKPDFTLFTWQSELRDLAGDKRARPHRTERKEEAVRVTQRVVTPAAPVEPPMSWQLKLRYAGLLVQPTRALEARNLWALVFYFLSFILPQVVLFVGTAFLACQVPEGVTPFIASVGCLTAVCWYVIYIGGVGPFDCGMREEEDDAPARSSRPRIHKYFTARFPAAVGLAIALITLESVLIALLFSREFSLSCMLNDKLSVNEAPSYSNLLLNSPLSGYGTNIPSNDGTAFTDSSSSRAYFAFRDGLVVARTDKDIVHAVNVTDREDGSIVVNDASTRASLGEPTRMLLVAPIFASTQDPYYLKRVPVWAVGSFSWSSPDSRQAIVSDWSSSYRFGSTLGQLDGDYRPAQQLIVSILADNSDMQQFIGAPLLSWQSSSDLETQVSRNIIVYLSVSGGLFLVIWFGLAVWHIRWYISMLDEELIFQTAINKRRGPVRNMTIQSRPATDKADDDLAAEEGGEQKHRDTNGNPEEEIELGALKSSNNGVVTIHTDDTEPSTNEPSILSPSQSTSTAAAGAGPSAIYPSISRSASLSSGVALLPASRPSSASVSLSSSMATASAQRSQSFLTRLWAPLTSRRGSGGNSISPDLGNNKIQTGSGGQLSDRSHPSTSAPPVVYRQGSSSKLEAFGLSSLPVTTTNSIGATSSTPPITQRAILNSSIDTIRVSRPSSATGTITQHQKLQPPGVTQPATNSSSNATSPPPLPPYVIPTLPLPTPTQGVALQDLDNELDEVNENRQDPQPTPYPIGLDTSTTLGLTNRSPRRPMDAST